MSSALSDEAAVAIPSDSRLRGEPVVQVEELTKRLGELVAVERLSFVLERGTVTGFLGPNGAGKTTTLRMLLHLVRPTPRAALVFGRHYEDLERPASRVGAVLVPAHDGSGQRFVERPVPLASAAGGWGCQGREPRPACFPSASRK